MKYFYNRLLNRALLIIILTIIVGVLIMINGDNKSNSFFESNYCRPDGITNGSDDIKLEVTKSALYNVWLRVETPIQISFNDLPGEYNPLLINIDNHSCYMFGGNNSISLNTWTWINNLNQGPNVPLKVWLSSGQHDFVITGSYISIDRIEIIKGSCVPINSGLNCGTSTPALKLPLKS